MPFAHSTLYKSIFRREILRLPRFFFFLPGEDIEFSRQFPFLYFRFRATLPTSSLSLLGKQGVVKQFLDWSCHYKKIHLSLLPLGLARVPLCPLLRIIHLLIAFTACLPFFLSSVLPCFNLVYTCWEKFSHNTPSHFGQTRHTILG